MSYQPYNLGFSGDTSNPTGVYRDNASGIVFFGYESSDPVFNASSSFVVDTGNSRAIIPNLTLQDGGVIGNTSETGILTFNADSSVEFISGVTIRGDLIVEGNQVIVNTETVTIDDNIIVLNDNNTNGLDQDAGIEVERGTSNTNVRLLWDEGNDIWTFTNNGSNYYRISSNSEQAAGSGLSAGGISSETRVLNIGQGNGITVSANSISVNPGTGISIDGNGVHVDSTVITDQTLMSSGEVAGDSDQILIYDSGVGLKRITGNDFIAGLDILTTFNVTDGTNVSALDRGEQLTFASGTGPGVGITPVVSTVNNAPVITLNINEDLILGRNDANFNTGDYMLFWDSDNAGLRRVSHAQLIDDIGDSISGVPSGTIMSYWTLYDDRTGVPNDGNIAVIYNQTAHQFIGNSGISVSVDGPYNRTTFALEATNVTTGTYGDADTVASFTVDQNGRLTAASGVDINITSNAVSDFESASKTAIFKSSNFVDTNTIDFTVNNGVAVSGVVKDRSITEDKRNRTISDIYSTSTLISTDVALASGGSGGLVLQLPNPSSKNGKMVHVKKIDSGNGIVAVSGYSTDTIDGASVKRLYYQYESLTCVCYDNNWYLV